jgi:hypothetical protein
MTDTSPEPGPFCLSDILAEEYEKLHGAQIKQLPPSAPKWASKEEAQRREKERLNKVYESIHDLTPKKRSALCFSGGGIRSATFCLGVIQALAQKGMLTQFDYLSTVSGGGYIGSWLTAWILRNPEGLDGVCKDLKDRLECPLTPEPGPLHWLRAYSNYLSPKLGIFSADGWTLVGTYLRNLLLNWMILLPFLMALLLIPRFHVAASRWSIPEWETPLLLLGLFLGAVCLTYLHLHRPSLVAPPSTWYNRLRAKESEPRFIFCCLLPFLLAAILLTLDWAFHTNHGGTLQDLTWDSLPGILSFALSGMILHMVSWLASGCWLMHEQKCEQPESDRSSDAMYKQCRWLTLEVATIAITGLAGGALLWSAAYGISRLNTVSSRVQGFAELYACLAVPVFIGVFLVVATLFCGLASQFTKEHDREWWGRSGSWKLSAGLAWLAVSVVVVAGPIGLVNVPGYVTSVGGVSGLIAILLGFSAKTKATEGGESQTLADRIMEWIPKLAAPLCIIVLLAGISWGTSAILEWLALSSDVGRWFTPEYWDTKGLFMPDLPSGHLFVVRHTPFGLLAGLFIIAVVISIFFARLVNINTFSLHALYRNRLVRAFLGASQGMRRSPNVFTGFDPCDNVELHSLVLDKRVQRPFHIINTAINLVGGSNLAWQERKAHSFTMSPLHCGSAVQTSSKRSDDMPGHCDQLGYRSSTVYGKNKDGAGGKSITLGTALAISGAAASPNMGYHTSAPVAFLLTLFNVRLGWWLGNPGDAGGSTYRNSCPTFALKPLLAEAFGWTDETHSYVYLSDGGHFENLGLYEMVVRRCRDIVVVDAGCDPDHTFEDLGNAIRKIRADLGIEVAIELKDLKLQSEDRLVTLQYAVGEIFYEHKHVDPQGEKKGLFLYLKPSLTGKKEPADVLQYRAKHKAFPHESTGDQFFSESQFESYRKLGEWIAKETLESARLTTTDLRALLEALQQPQAPVSP